MKKYVLILPILCVMFCGCIMCGGTQASETHEQITVYKGGLMDE